MKKYFFVFTLAIFLFSCKNPSGSEGLKLVELTCENFVNPISIDIQNPLFSWKLAGNDRSQLQTAYHIMIADSKEKLEKNEANVWDSGKTASDQSLDITYAGIPLKSNTQYFWKVMVWDANEKPSPWSEAAHFTTAYLNESEWKAKWIGMDTFLLKEETKDFHTVLAARMLRKEVNLKAKIERARIFMCGLGLSELYVNGNKIGDQVLSPGLTEYKKRSLYVVHDVTKYLSEGANALGVILGNGRYFAPRGKGDHTNTYGFPKLLLQMEVEYSDGTKETLISDDSWKLTANGPILANNEYDGEVYDARKELSGWDKVGFDDKSWLKVQLVQKPSQRLEAERAEPLRVVEEIKPISVKELKPGVLIYDLGQNMVGWVKLKVSGKNGEKIQLRFAETLKGDGSLYTDNLRTAKARIEYIMKGDSLEVYEPRFTYFGFRYVELSGYSGKADDNTIIGCVVHDDMKQIGSFNTSNETINNIAKNIYWGTRGNYRSIVTDCPQRDERQGWLGDRGIGAKGESFMFDIKKFYNKWLVDIRDAMTEEGSIPDVAPTYWAIYNDNATWAGAYILIVDMMYRQFSDLRLLNEHYDAMKKWILYMKKYIHNDLMGKDTYGDWCMPPESLDIIWSKDPKRITSANMLGSSYYYHQLKIMTYYAELLGKKEDVKTFEVLSAQMLKGMNSQLLDTLSLTYANNTATSSILPLAYDMVPEKYQAKIFDNLVYKIMSDANGHIASGLVGCQWIMRVLSDNGRPDIAYKLATNRTYPSWGYMIDNGATTIWELWNGNTANPAMNSGNHVMLNGDLAIWFYEYLAGIQSDISKPGFKNIIMKPLPVGDLKFVNASYESRYGAINSSWKIKDGCFYWEVEIPANTTAEIYLPAQSMNDIEESGLKLEKVSSVEFLRIEENHVVCKIGSGKYSFVSLGYKPFAENMNYVATPEITPAYFSAVSPASVKVQMKTKTSDSEIRYTLDGNEPNENSLPYKGEIVIDKYTTILARAFKSGYIPSLTVSATMDIYPVQNQWSYMYYEIDNLKMLPDFSKYTAKSVGSTFDLNPSKIKKREDNFAFKFTGFLNVPIQGKYNLTLTSDDGSRLLINDKEVINLDGIHGMEQKMGVIELKTLKNKIVLEYFDGTQGDGLELYISGPQIPFQKLPAFMISKN